MNYPRFVPLLGLVLLTGCAGKPTTYLSLAPQSAAHPIIALPGAPIAVAHVAIPPSLDRLYLTSQLNPNQLHVASHARWAAPLDGLTQRTLAQDIALRLPRSDILMPGDPVPRGGVRLVRVNVGQFIFRADDRVALTADWSIVSPHHHVVAHHRTQVSAPSGPSPTQQAAAMSNTLGLLADRIAQALSG